MCFIQEIHQDSLNHGSSNKINLIKNSEITTLMLLTSSLVHKPFSHVDWITKSEYGTDKLLKNNNNC
jgi:hypothetical protein